LGVVDPGFLKGGDGEWPKATRGVGCGEGGVPSSMEWGLGWGCALPRKF